MLQRKFDLKMFTKSDFYKTDFEMEDTTKVKGRAIYTKF